MDRRKKKPSELYVCMFDRCDSFNAYRVYAMKLSDLFTVDRTPTPLISSDSKLKHVDAVIGKDVPMFMDFGLFGSRIVLVGGRPPGCSDSVPTHSLETKSRLIGRVLIARPPSCSTIHPIHRQWMVARMYDLSLVDDSDGDRGCLEVRPRRFKSPDVIPSLKGDKRVTWLREIQGKLYALTVDDSKSEVTFLVFDPNSHRAVWTPLPKLPVDYEYCGPVALRYSPVRPSNIAIVGTKIFVTLPVKHAGEEGKMVYFDVAHPKRGQKWRSIKPRNGRDPIGVCGEVFNDVLVVDLEGNPFHKLLFSLDGDGNIAVSRMVLSDHGLPHTVERVAEIEIRLSSEQLEEYEPHSYKFVHLGGRKVCFVFFCRQILVMLTFKFSYSYITAAQQHLWRVLNDGAGDAEVLTCTPSIKFRGSFSVETLGFRLFDYNPEDLCIFGLGGCFLL